MPEKHSASQNTWMQFIVWMVVRRQGIINGKITFSNQKILVDGKEILVGHCLLLFSQA